jgi:hypothetical protein
MSCHTGTVLLRRHLDKLCNFLVTLLNLMFNLAAVFILMTTRAVGRRRASTALLVATIIVTDGKALSTVLLYPNCG